MSVYLVPGGYEVMFYDGVKKTVQNINIKVMPPEVQVEVGQLLILQILWDFCRRFGVAVLKHLCQVYVQYVIQLLWKTCKCCNLIGCIFS